MMLLIIDNSETEGQVAVLPHDSEAATKSKWKRSGARKGVKRGTPKPKYEDPVGVEGQGTQSDDAVLIQFALGGDELAFDKLFIKYKTLVQVVIYRVIGNAQAVEDLMQETFLKVFLHLPNLAESGCFRSWLTRIASNSARDYLRKSGSRERYLAFMTSESKDGNSKDGVQNGGDPVYHGAEADEWVETVKREIQALPKIYRNVASMRYLGASTYPEIARELNLPTETVKRRSGRARVMLQDRLQSWSMYD